MGANTLGDILLENFNGHHIVLASVDYVGPVEKVVNVGDCTTQYNLTIFIRGQKLVLYDSKEKLEQVLAGLLNAKKFRPIP
jgi:hypothetical protein